MVAASQSTDIMVSFGVPIVGLGAGHLYAGDPLRAAAVTVGGTVAGLGTYVFLSSLLAGKGGNGGGGAFVIGALSLLAVECVIAGDAFWTVEQKNREATLLGGQSR